MDTTRVGILLGSDSDWSTMEICAETLDHFGVEHEVEVRSCHRTPKLVEEYATQAQGRGIEVIIAGAGMAAALAGTVAAHTALPVIGVPVASGPLHGIDALLSTAQMPPGVPVATVGIGSAGAKNAALLAVQILARSDERIDAAYKQFKIEQAEQVERKNKALQEKLRR